MREWRLRTAQRSFYRPATARRVGEGQLGQSSRGKKSQSAYLLAPWISCSGESKSSPPAHMDGQSRKIASLEIQPESQTRDDRSDDRFWLERKGKAVTGVHWLVRIDSREMPQRAFPQSRSNLHLGRVRKGVFCMATSLRDAEIRVDNLAHEPPPSPHDRRRKNLFLHKSGDTAATSPFSSTRSLNTT